MEMRWLEAFVNVSEELHFGRAAQKMGIAQSVLSQHIRRLEKEINAQLFDRSTRSVEITAAGEAFLPHARSVLAGVEAGRFAVTAAEGEVVGRVRIGMSGIHNYSTLPKLARAVRQQLPRVQMEYVGNVFTAEAVKSLHSGGLDIAYLSLPVADPELETRLIHREPLGIVVPTGHRAALRPAVALSSLANDPFIMAPADAGSALRRATLSLCAEAGFKPKMGQNATDPFVMLLLVAAGVGVAIAPESVASMVPPGAVYRPILNASLDLQHGIGWLRGEGTPARDAVIAIARSMSSPT